MPGDPGSGEGHIINYRVDDLEVVVGVLRQDGVEVSPIEVGPGSEVTPEYWPRPATSVPRSKGCAL
jgi:hypothetical protein